MSRAQRAPSALRTLLLEAWTNALEFDGSCWVRRAAERNSNYWGTAITALDEGRARHDFVKRIRDEHPSNRSHVDAHDDGVLMAFTEAEAFAWGFREGHRPRFVFEPGAPDLLCVSGDWIEAKTVRASDDDRLAWRQARERARAQGRMPSRFGPVTDVNPGLVAKLERLHLDATTKWRRQSAGNLTIFVCVSELDFEIDWDEAWSAIKQWALKSKQSRVRLVVTWNHDWEHPRLDSTAS